MEEKKKASEIISNLYEKRRELIVERMKAVNEVVKLYFDLNNGDNLLVPLTDFDESRTTSVTLLSNFEDESELLKVKGIVLNRQEKSIFRIVCLNESNEEIYTNLAELANDDIETILELILDKM